jgi:hypothetical protein
MAERLHAWRLTPARVGIALTRSMPDLVPRRAAGILAAARSVSAGSLYASVQKIAYQRRRLHQMRLEQPMSAVEQMQLGIRKVT